MCYLGNKTKLLTFIEKVIDKYKIEGETFADLFAGTGSIGDYFKGKYTVYSNDYMYFSKVISEAKLSNFKTPDFKEFHKKYGVSPFEWLNKKQYKTEKSYFTYNNYTPLADRMYFTEDNALKIDGMRLDIEELFHEDYISKAEYSYLLASLLDWIARCSYRFLLKIWKKSEIDNPKFVEVIPLTMTLYYR